MRSIRFLCKSGITETVQAWSVEREKKKTGVVGKNEIPSDN